MTRTSTPLIVGVIFTHADLQRALGIRNPPDLFEVRLDALAARGEEVSAALGKLSAPLIITARHPREGGINQLSVRERRALLRSFLSQAAYVDIELRAASGFAEILKEARSRQIRIIISFHDLDKTPSRPRLDRIAQTARTFGADILKIATRTDTSTQLARLREFFQSARQEMKIAAMGFGRLGRVSRIDFARDHSALNYGHLGRPQAEGQLSCVQLRRILQ